MNPIAAVLATVRIEMPSEGVDQAEGEVVRPYLPPIVDQLEAYRAAVERETEDAEVTRQVDARLARLLGVTLEELKAAARSGALPAAERPSRFYVTRAAAERWLMALREPASHS